MISNDVIVIGSGLSGLIAAAVAAEQGKKVSVLTYGAGTLTIGGGIIDVIGYSDDGEPLKNPAEGLCKINNTHPYKKIGVQAVAEAIEFFKKIAKAEGYDYLGDLNKMQWVPTAVGTIKPTCLVPKSMNGEVIKQADKLLVVGFDILKDFYPQLVAKNLQKIYNTKKVESTVIKLNFERGRDITTLDVARWLETCAGRESFIQQMRNEIEAKTTVVLPPVLGTKPDYEVLNTLEEALKCRFIESVVLPPSVGGIRLRTMLLNYLKKVGVKIIEKAAVVRAVVTNGVCKAVITRNFDRERAYFAKSFILASGGLYGGGLLAEPGRIIETVFDLPVTVPEGVEIWSNDKLFSNEKQPFAKFGIAVNELMTPIADDGRVLLENVKVVGRNLAGYDFCFEKSGNGVALASGYKGAMSLMRGEAHYE